MVSSTKKNSLESKVMEKTFKSICVMGLGYIGLPTASFLGSKGYQVTGVDVSQEIVDTINQGNIHIVEPDLDLLVRSSVNAGNLKASKNPVEADVFMIAVQTPFKDSYTPDLSYVENATKAISPFIKPGDIVILESTSPVGTTEEIVGGILRGFGHDIENDIFIAHCPERVLPGRILIELVHNDRIVGGINSKSTRAAADFYREFVSGQVLETSAATAELCKLAENSYRDVNIAFANELSMICDQENIDPWELIELANHHPRVNILNPGPGVGGHCISVDPWFIVSRSSERAKLIQCAREVNHYKPMWVIDRIKAKAENLKRPVIACLGLAFKPDVDDLRGSPAVQIVNELRKMGIGKLLIAEPLISSHPEFELVHFEVAVDKADIVVILVDHKAFRSIDYTKMNEKIVIDTCGATKR
jgi:UDP-N-acetyl-D-mannosaminuronic acid dehydrogenase